MKARGPKSGFRKTIPLRRDLRHNSTSAEKSFWSKVRNKQFLNLRFRKQRGIGNYIVDFYCPEKKLIVVVDGDTHAETQNEMKDQERTIYLESFGYKIVRYQNRDILNNIDGVFQDLIDRINKL